MCVDIYIYIYIYIYTMGKLRSRWEGIIKMDLQEVGVGRRDWMEMAQDRDRWRALVRTVRDFPVP